jgi:hypothetical protein
LTLVTFSVSKVAREIRRANFLSTRKRPRSAAPAAAS